MKKLLVSILMAASVCVAEEVKQSTSLYGKNEFVLALAGTWTTPSANFDVSHGAVGISASGTKYFNQYVGATAEIGVVDLYNVGNLIIDNVAVGGTLRYPITDRIAPFGRVLVGREFSSALYKFETGAGVECRLSKRLGVFVEGRHQWFIDGNDIVLFQGGVTAAF